MVARRADLNLRRYGDLQKDLGFGTVVAGEGFEPSKAEPGDLQSWLEFLKNKNLIDE